MAQSHTFKGFDEALNRLRADIRGMGDKALAAVDAAVAALAEHDRAAAEAVIDSDRDIDLMQFGVDDAQLHALTEHAAVAGDLREILVAGRIAADLERIGDHAGSIAKRVLLLRVPLETGSLFQVKRLYTRARDLLTGVMTAYARRDGEAARELWASDAELDGLYRQLFESLMDDRHAGGHDAAVATHLMFVAKSVERIGDHATNIAEEVVFLATGDRVTDPRPKQDLVGHRR
ncbi:phosphate signaling complex protein PhoU [Spectribacter hydrogenoxidans]|uniref:Phosphate-specific transport system accessory protein PhoU n=1 Tax=Spectribacter hydrogenoxidans TaxID=3075608 RepID=A0ABU3C1U5_9GAMM|nr:phosphate signaling complex protein PhoU [Salinisphaera sp. W335]MDT0635531.1 phosphate signaling complex protein PhoU [Salinisphaera sp. W335]